jgi:hypothetical protein
MDKREDSIIAAAKYDAEAESITKYAKEIKSLCKSINMIGRLENVVTIDCDDSQNG